MWGARSLAALYPEKANLPEPIGEVWLTGVDCKIATGPFASKTLGEAWSKMTAGWGGTALRSAENFPLLLKFIFPADKLSIQVHPNDSYASLHEAAAGGRGKTEMWYVVSAEPGAQLFAGLKPGATRESFSAALADHKLEDLLQAYEVRARDTFFIPAGMPHTIGPGMVICEVQEYSDLTYRVYDYDRVDARGKPRELHVEKALAVIDFRSDARAKVETRPLQIQGEKVGESLVECSYFSTFRKDITRRVHFRMAPGPREQFQLWVFLEGQGEIAWTTVKDSELEKWDGGGFKYNQGECWFIPAEFGSHGFDPKQKTSILIATPRSAKVESGTN